MKVTNHNGKAITLKLSTEEAAIITEALRKYGADEMVEKMMNGQEVVRDD